jgi:hypothetical protein
MKYSEKLKYYKYRSKNYAGVCDSLDTVENSMRDAVRRDDRKSLKSLQQIYTLLIAASAEARLQKILFEPNKFTEEEIVLIFNTKVHLNKWECVVKTAFKKKCNLPSLSNLEKKLAFTDKQIYLYLINVLNAHLSIIIEIRNKLAHGQWEYPFINTNEGISTLEDIKISTRCKRVFERENFLTLKLKRNMINSILDIVRDLVVSHSTLRRDIDSRFKK